MEYNIWSVNHVQCTHIKYAFLTNILCFFSLVFFLYSFIPSSVHKTRVSLFVGRCCWCYFFFPFLLFRITHRELGGLFVGFVLVSLLLSLFLYLRMSNGMKCVPGACIVLCGPSNNHLLWSQYAILKWTSNKLKRKNIHHWWLYS